MLGRKHPPKGPIRPDINRPIGVDPVGNWKNHFVFSICPVGRAKLFSLTNLDATPILLREIGGLSSSNRLAIATEHTRGLALQLESSETLSSDEAQRYFAEMNASAERSELLIRALRAFYFAIRAFALATLLSLLGLAMETFDPLGLVRPLEILALAAGAFAFGGLVTVAVKLLRETRLAVRQLDIRSRNLRGQSRSMGTPHCGLAVMMQSEAKSRSGVRTAV